MFASCQQNLSSIQAVASMGYRNIRHFCVHVFFFESHALRPASFWCTPHKLPLRSQVRLHALAACHELFLRSKTFRVLLAPNITPFLVLTVGHRSDTPLPGPSEVAAQLRQKALESLEGWDERFGSLYGQVQSLLNTHSIGF